MKLLNYKTYIYTNIKESLLEIKQDKETTNKQENQEFHGKYFHEIFSFVHTNSF